MSRSTGWTAHDIPYQHGRLALVTGATGGIGTHTALELARAGAAVLLTGRDEEKLEETADAIRAEVGAAEVETLLLDLADLASVRRAADIVVGSGRALDLLVNNAAVMAVPRRRTTTDGFELTFGTNHLGHFALTGQLLPALLRADAPRVVTVSALLARWRTAALVDVNSVRRYSPMRAYAKSKLANVMFTQELTHRARNSPLAPVAVHPGVAATGLQRHTSAPVRWATDHLLTLLAGTPASAALPSLYAATAPGVDPGSFIGPTGFAETRGTPGPVRLPSRALDADRALELWTKSGEVTGVTYDFG
ncbi:oxidoreductase [Streptomyces tsukubensis]|uniref:Ketoreductase domain-containing protein n=1 Tax=Streptomyces tsukubensis TaxID=83656 RepID=A0A1V4A8Y6_9ACTN|nr:oxidoreductase [Streptomyces tsukubensis]OON78742.1 hypothetical protein B1H18_15235 [Streptomyces tsukubensis]QFR94214.1 SDR family NAD(P)-dependent oxidoreductase [Streptomyces tsukubensis]